jgi:hypothetical protein
VERRRGHRIEVNLHLTCRVPAKPSHAILYDISHTGCKIEIQDDVAPLGATALVDMPCAPGFPGVVVWARGRMTGIRFSRRLGHAAACAVGLEIAPEPITEPDDIKAPITLSGRFQHWMRRLADHLR